MTENNIVYPSNDRRTLARNSILNVAGQAAPLFAALVAVPGLLGALGAERFGVLTLAWLVVGYFSLFDLGIGRALTKLVAERQTAATQTDVQALIWSALGMLAAIGVLIAIGLAAATGWITASVLKMPRDLQQEAATTFYVLAATIPFVISTAALRGVLEAQRRFGAVNVIRIPLGMLNFLGPWVAVTYTHELPLVVTVLAVLRIVAWLAHLGFCGPTLRRGGPTLNAAAARTLLSLGAWMTISNVVGPLMVYLDRFLVGALLSMAAVAYYSTPYEIVTKLWVLPAALAGVLFPAFAMHVREDAQEAGRLLALGIKWVFLLVFPLTLLVVVFAFDGLAAWLNPDFAANSFRALQLLAMGVLLNCIAQMPFAFLQAAGRADLTAKLHVLELVPYLLAAYWLIAHYGIVGAAVAWLIRVAFDLLALLAFLRTWLAKGTLVARHCALVAGVALALLLVGALAESLLVKAVYAATVFAAFGFIAWRVSLSAGEKYLLCHPLELFGTRSVRLRP